MHKDSYRGISILILLLIGLAGAESVLWGEVPKAPETTKSGRLPSLFHGFATGPRCEGVASSCVPQWVEVDACDNREQMPLGNSRPRAATGDPCFHPSPSVANAIVEGRGSPHGEAATDVLPLDTLPNLTPYQPQGWSDKIVVSKTTGTHQNSSSILNTDILYVDYAVANTGDAYAPGFKVAVYLDRVLIDTWTADGLDPGAYGQREDHAVGPLCEGSHVIGILVNHVGEVVESDLNDNYVGKTLTIGTHPGSLPNLVPYTPAGWSDRIVVSKDTGAHTDSSPLFTTDTLYIDHAVINSGTAKAGTHKVGLYVDGVLRKTYSNLRLCSGYFQPWQNYNIGSLTAGSHTIGILADTERAIQESNEVDNGYQRVITVYDAANFPNLTPYKPTGWCDTLVVSKTTGTYEDDVPFGNADPLYLDFSVLNSDSSEAPAFGISIYVDGALTGTVYTDATLPGRSFFSTEDYVIGPLPEGNHALKIVVDSEGVIQETNESDNEASKTITVSAPGALPNLTPYKPLGWSDKIVVSKVEGTLPTMSRSTNPTCFT